MKNKKNSSLIGDSGIIEKHDYFNMTISVICVITMIILIFLGIMAIIY